jgi:hypothetical protein
MLPQVVDKEEERRVEFLERMQLVMPQALLQLSYADVC